jgi:hypothetical protein
LWVSLGDQGISPQSDLSSSYLSRSDTYPSHFSPDDLYPCDASWMILFGDLSKK